MRLASITDAGGSTATLLVASLALAEDPKAAKPAPAKDKAAAPAKMELKCSQSSSLATPVGVSSHAPGHGGIQRQEAEREDARNATYAIQELPEPGRGGRRQSPRVRGRAHGLRT